jgi:hypothetical protein
MLSMGLTRHDVCLHAVRMVQSCEDRRLRSYKLDIVGRAGFTDLGWTCSGRKPGPGVVYRKEVVGGSPFGKVVIERVLAD